jgi:hypothetical protein
LVDAGLMHVSHDAHESRIALPILAPVMHDRFWRGWGDVPTLTYIYSAARFPSYNLTTEVEEYLSSISRSPLLVGNEERCLESCTLKYDRVGIHGGL